MVAEEVWARVCAEIYFRRTYEYLHSRRHLANKSIIAPERPEEKYKRAVNMKGHLPWDGPEVSIRVGHKPYLQQLLNTFEKVLGVRHIFKCAFPDLISQHSLGKLLQTAQEDQSQRKEDTKRIDTLDGAS